MITTERIRKNVLTVQQQAEMFLLDTCIHRKISGYITVSGQAIAQITEETIPCRISNKSAADRVQVASQYRSTQQAINERLTRLHLPIATEVAVKDQFIVNGNVYDVEYVMEKHALMGSFWVWLRSIT